MNRSQFSRWRQYLVQLLSLLAIVSLAAAGAGAEQPIDNGITIRPFDPGTAELNERTTTNINAADTTNADQLWAGGGLGLNLTGSGVTVGIWDGGAVLNTHQELSPRVTVVDAVAAADHATHVAGTIGAIGVNAAAKGMASSVLIRSREWTNDTSEMASDAPLIQLSNHSYSYVRGWAFAVYTTPGHPNGVDRWFGDRAVSATEDRWFGLYSSTGVALDNVIYNNPHLLSVWSAGNDRGNYFTNYAGNGRYLAYFSTAPSSYHENLGGGYYVVSAATGHPAPPTDGNGGTGYDSLSNDGQTAKNVLVVGSIADHTVDPQNGSTISVSYFSSYGPTDDGRLAPHVVANGESLTSSLATSNTAYGSYSGTSMAAPNVTGTAALLNQHYKNVSGVIPMAATQKAYLVHTATDVTSGTYTVGPDYATGYGLVNAAGAATLIAEAFQEPLATRDQHILEDSTTVAGKTLDNWIATGSQIKATLAWTDRAGTAKSSLDDPTPVLVNDLNLWITDELSNTYYPWTLDPLNPANAAVRTTANHVDNLEQVLIDASVLGRHYTVHIGTTGALWGGLPQDYSLILSGLQPVPEPGTLVMLLGFAVMSLVWYARLQRRRAM